VVTVPKSCDEEASQNYFSLESVIYIIFVKSEFEEET
jgi:hypothetical protein